MMMLLCLAVPILVITSSLVIRFGQCFTSYKAQWLSGVSHLLFILMMFVARIISLQAIQAATFVLLIHANSLLVCAAMFTMIIRY